MAKDNRYDYINEHKRQNYDRVVLLVRKGGKDSLKALADERGTSVNQIAIEALEQFYGISLSK